MPTSQENATRRRQNRINLLKSNQSLRSYLAGYLHSNFPSPLHKLIYKHKLIRKVRRTFANAGKSNALPRKNSDLINQMRNADNAIFREEIEPQIRRARAIREMFMRTINQNEQKTTYRANVPRLRNASLTKNKNGNPVVVYFPNNK